MGKFLLDNLVLCTAPIAMMKAVSTHTHTYTAEGRVILLMGNGWVSFIYFSPLIFPPAALVIVNPL